MDLWQVDCDVLVVPSNGVGATGAGIAKQCALRYPGSTEPYKKACRAGLQVPGQIFSWEAPDGKIIAFLPTKRHWRDKSNLNDVKLGLTELRRKMIEKNMTVALPPVGCGLGGLCRVDVQALVNEIFGYEPRLVLCGW